MRCCGPTTMLALLSLTGTVLLLTSSHPRLMPSASGPERPSAGPVRPNSEGRSTLAVGDELRSGYPLDVTSTKYTHPYKDMHGAPYEAEYVPAEFESGGLYEAKLAVPSKAAQDFFDARKPYVPFMEEKCGVTAAVDLGAIGGMIVTLKGSRQSVEYCRAEMRETVLNKEMGRVKRRQTRTDVGRHEDFEHEEVLSVPDGVLNVFWRASGRRRIQELERVTGARIQVSDEPDPEDPTARLVYFCGKTMDAAGNGRRELRSMLRTDLAAAVDSVTPAVWQIVSMRIDPERAMLVIGEDGSIANDLVAKTGCRIQFSAKIRESPNGQQLVRITGPGDKPNDVRREIERLIRKGEVNMPRRVFDNLAAQNSVDMKAAQQHYEELRVAQQQYNNLKSVQGGRSRSVA
eukprot:g8750.t1